MNADRHLSGGAVSRALTVGTGGAYDDLTVASNHDQDYFAVEADAGDTITVDVAFDHSNGDIDAVLTDEHGYSLDVYPWSGAPNDYNISIQRGT